MNGENLVRLNWKFMKDGLKVQIYYFRKRDKILRNIFIWMWLGYKVIGGVRNLRYGLD